jgi:hypothetical protein
MKKALMLGFLVLTVGALILLSAPVSTVEAG